MAAARPYAWPHDASFSRETTALVIVDMQRDFCSPGGYLTSQGYSITATRSIIPCLQRLLIAFRASGYQIYHTREGHRRDLSTLSPREAFRSRNNASGLGIGDPGPLGRLLIRGEEGHDTIPELYPLPGEPVIDKPGRGAFAHTDFELLLRVRGIRNLVVCGVTTDVCVSSTMREANDRGFDCLLLEDGCAAAEEELHEATVRGVQMEGGIFGAVGRVDDVIEMLKRAGADEV
ncbi:hypothetical protein W97_04837 [Coniosporium apollinis CBS 100218]|uniref:Isochorismatase-like domain-containing protein n=1 Tax=Coniosporium apollinis (strain CBS 100218) TaxID=1168221 RepID=R7YUY5_CONA1|nr:uncharacterized protein W97_04837 [Coniosporium apollinis CBS 100218]EON65599.1 hypothetical protein W97_04837 [Coniosporium apollinis CBS 100218]